MSYDQILQNALYEQNPNLSTRELSEKSRYETEYHEEQKLIRVAGRDIKRTNDYRRY